MRLTSKITRVGPYRLQVAAITHTQNDLLQAQLEAQEQIAANTNKAIYSLKIRLWRPSWWEVALGNIVTVAIVLRVIRERLP